MDYELFEVIITGVHKNILKIDEIISKNLSSNWSIDRLSQTEKTVLRSATYELLFENKFKKLTIMNEYISIFEVFGGNADFANGILDNISKEKRDSKKKSNERFTILIAEFYSKESALILKRRITQELTNFNSKKLFIKSNNANKTTLLSGPYNSINLMKNDYIELKKFGFEDLDLNIYE